jgi:hypothetical protein
MKGLQVNGDVEVAEGTRDIFSMSWKTVVKIGSTAAGEASVDGSAQRGRLHAGGNSSVSEVVTLW